MRSDRRKTPATVVPSPKAPNARRRGFLLALGAGGAGAAALAARSLGGVASQAESSTDSEDGKGYQVTEHVRRYYRTAKV
jgi:hypothetical protein